MCQLPDRPALARGRVTRLCPWIDPTTQVVGVIMAFRPIAAIRLSAFWLPGPFSLGKYAFVYRAGLSNETRPFKLGLWDKSHNFAHGTLQI
jgi:hypothetical protein